MSIPHSTDQMHRLVRIVSLAIVPLFAAAITLQAQSAPVARENGPLQVSGIYPHLTVFNDTGNVQDNECGIGAVVPWAGRLWLLTYPPHRRTGSADKLYEIDSRLEMTIRPESVGGTHAGRMIHWESQQLIIGPYFIDASGNVRAIDQTKGLPARITAVARHLTDPANKVYLFDMEGPVWEVDVHTLAFTRLFVKSVPGWHGKGAYTSQGRFIIANNGERQGRGVEDLPWEAPESTWSRGPEDVGALAEFDGHTWSIISRRPHTEVTGPGGILGERAADAPVWSVGWDKRSLLLHVRSDGAWHRFRLPKGSYTFDPIHGWFTEWPRIRAIGEGQLLLNMHGTFFDFPATFTGAQARGIRPLATHLHYTTDFAEWNGGVVLAGDDTSIQQNPLAAKPQSNLRFVSRPQLAYDFGPRSGWGGVWIDDQVQAGSPSDPFLIAGYAERSLHLAHKSKAIVTFTIEIDANGDGQWQEWKAVPVPATGYLAVSIPRDVAGEWLRVKTDRDAVATAFVHAQTSRETTRDEAATFDSLATRRASSAWTGGLLRPAAFSRDLQFLARPTNAKGASGPEVYYEVNERLEFKRVEAADKVAELKRVAEPTADYTVDDASVLVIDDEGRRWRLPRRADAVETSRTRGVREVISERYLAHFDGTFYEIPRRGEKTVPDFLRIKPVASHDRRIADFATWRGMLVMSGTALDARLDGHFFQAAKGGPGLWFGAIDDLYKLGTPSGVGGPWKDAAVEAGAPSDPYLMTNFERKSVTLSHDSGEPVRFTIEVDVLADGTWFTYDVIAVPQGQRITHRFPEGFSAHWVRVTADRTTKATAWFEYAPSAASSR